MCNIIYTQISPCLGSEEVWYPEPFMAVTKGADLHWLEMVDGGDLDEICFSTSPGFITPPHMGHGRCLCFTDTFTILGLLDTDSLFLPLDIVGTSRIPFLGDIKKYKVVTKSCANLC